MIVGFLLFAILFVALSLIFEHFLKERELTGIKGSPHSVSPELQGELLSEKLRVYGCPDGVIREEGNIIPVERKTFSKKVRSRHIVQLAVYMSLLEDYVKKPVPYGYLILGKNRKQRKIYNSDDLRRKVRLKARELVNIIEGLNQPIPDPYPSKCRQCVVRDACKFKQT